MPTRYARSSIVVGSSSRPSLGAEPNIEGHARPMSLFVINPGLFSTMQDEGRPGYREWGVPVGGVFDRHSAALANALLGNPGDCAVVELTLFGGTYEARAPLALALAGAPLAASIAAPGDQPRPLSPPQSFV